MGALLMLRGRGATKNGGHGNIDHSPAIRLSGAGSPMAFGRSRGKLYAQEDIDITGCRVIDILQLGCLRGDGIVESEWPADDAVQCASWSMKMK